MRFMAGWSWDDLMCLPQDYYDVIVTEANAEAEAIRKSREGR